QGLWAIAGLCGMIFMANFDYWKLKKFSKLFLFVSILLLVAVLFFGTELNKAKRWLYIGPFSFQPSEIAILALIIYLSDSLSKDKKKASSFWKGVIPSLMVTGVLFLLIMKQPNMSTAGILVMITF